jgi:predicted nucleic acid-binding protein
MLAYLDGEPAARVVRQLLRHARCRRVFVLFAIISYGETLYVIERERGLQQAQRTVGIVDQLPIHIVPADRALVFAAAHVKARHPVSFADAFNIALAQRHEGRVMTGDPEFRTVEREVAIDWLPDLRSVRSGPERPRSRKPRQ